MAGVFGGIQQSSIASGGPKLPDGFHGILEIVNESVKSGFHGVVHIAEMVVHESNSHEAPVGYRPSWTANFKQPNTLGNVMCHIGACLGYDPKQEAALRAAITEQVAEYCISEHQPLRGRFVEVSTEEIKTKGNNDFLVHRWSPTKKTFPSRINDAPVAGAAPQAPALPPQVQMPGGFAPPQGSPGMPQGMPPGFGTPPQGFSPPQGFPQLPGAPMPGQAPQIPHFGAPTPPALPSAFAPQGGTPFSPPQLSLPPLPMQSSPPVVAAFPPPGWKAHPQAPGWYYLESDPRQQKQEADLMRAGR